METARAIGSGRIGGVSMRHNIQPQQHQHQLQHQFVVSASPSVLLDPNLGAPTMNYPIIDQFIPSEHTHQHQHQPMAVPMSQMTFAPLSVPAPAPAPQPTVPVTPKPTSNVINGAPFKLPSVQDRLIKNRVFFDENLRNVAQTGNGVGNK